MTSDFSEDLMAKWWISINNDSAKRAELRRTATSLDVMLVRSFYDLVWMMPDANKNKLAIVALAICHVEINSSKHIFELMGRKEKNSDSPRVSEIRFRRIIESPMEEAARAIIRVLPMIDYEANVADLAKKLYYWDSETGYSRKNSAEDYYLANEKKVSE